MLNICLINPPHIVPRSWSPPVIFPPLGLGYIAAVLEKEYDVSVIDANAEDWRNLKEINEKYCSGLTPKEIRKRIKRVKPDAVGITVPFSVNESSALTVASIVKSIDENIITILGGHHPSVRPIETLLHPAVDFVVIGEGEYTILELIQKLEKTPTHVLHVNGIGYKKNGKHIITHPRPLIPNLDLIPFPAWHLFPMKEYFASAKANRDSRGKYVFNDRWTSVITSRGCPYNCNFCSIHLTMGNKFRARSPENVIQELELLVHKYHIKHINFEDDNMTLNKSRFKLICDMIIERKLDITWSAPNGIRADTLDEEVVVKMKKSGCKRVFVAPESGVQRVVTYIIKKNLDLRKVEEAIVLLKKHGIIVDGSFIIGVIGETKDDIWKTIEYAQKLRRLGMNDAMFHIATPLYGTELYKEAKEKGYLRKEMDSSILSASETLIETPEWTASEIRALQKKSALINISYIPFRKKLLFALRNPDKIIQNLKYVKDLKVCREIIKSFLVKFQQTIKNR